MGTTNEINELAKASYTIARMRQKTTRGINHWWDYLSIKDELDEFCRAEEQSASEHLPEFSEAVEELADVALAAITEMYKRDVDVAQVLWAKVKFNAGRIPESDKRAVVEELRNQIAALQRDDAACGK